MNSSMTIRMSFVFQATIYKSELIFDNFEHEFDVSDPDFDHSSILEWEIPETECPDEISQRVRIGISLS